MCEYCGCQAIAAIDLLTREHGAALEEVADARVAANADDFSAAQTACARILYVLAPHMVVEEQALFPALAVQFAAQIQTLVAEHRLLDRVLDSIVSASTPPPGWASELLTALDILREHILKELDGVFPAALANLHPADWDRLDTVREQVGCSIDVQPLAL
jgi:hypothetical protein